MSHPIYIFDSDWAELEDDWWVAHSGRLASRHITYRQSRFFRRLRHRHHHRDCD